MPPKRPGEPFSFEKAEKWSKLLDDEEASEDDLEKNEDSGRAPVPDSPPQSPESTIYQLKSYLLKGNTALARQLLDYQTVDLSTPEGSELLWTAYYKDQYDIAPMLLRHGADLSYRGEYDEGTLPHAILRAHFWNDHAATKKFFCLLLDHGADIEARDGKGRSLLHCAITSFIEGSSFELALELLKRGAQITINKDDDRMDDFRLACKHKMELLPHLVIHQEPDEETRNRRATLAIEGLIFENYTGAKGDAALQIIKKILDFGVPVDGPKSQRNQKLSYLGVALLCKNRPVIKLLLDCGADPHQWSLGGQTTLCHATEIKGYTQVCRWLIERGVSIHARNMRGGYPIHGACEHESVRNLHLLLNLGADLNSRDRYGQTPFGAMKMKEKQKVREAHHLIIKHLALRIARGEKISKKDVAKISECTWSQDHFDRCKEQLERMKTEKMYNDVSYFLLLSKNMYSTVQLMKNQNFLHSFKRNENKRGALFPEFFYMLLHSFEVAEKRLQVLSAEKEKLHEVFKGALPDHIVEKITYYLVFDKLEHCQHDYFMAFHAKLRNVKTLQ